MKPTKLFYYAPAIQISSLELLDIAANYIKQEEWEKEELCMYYKSPKNPYLLCNFEYKNISIDARIAGLDKDTPIIITGTNQRQMQKVASKLMRLLKFDLIKVNEGEFVSSCNLGE